MNIIKTINFEAMIDFIHDFEEKYLICRFSGRLDTLNCVSLSEEIQNKIQELKQGQPDKDQFEERIHFDMKDVTYISSSFIRICLHTYHQSKKGNFSIINSDPFLKKTFKIAGLGELLSVS
jgi:anti-anti-sigma factor